MKAATCWGSIEDFRWTEKTSYSQVMLNGSLSKDIEKWVSDKKKLTRKLKVTSCCRTAEGASSFRYLHSNFVAMEWKCVLKKVEFLNNVIIFIWVYAHCWVVEVRRKVDYVSKSEGELWHISHNKSLLIMYGFRLYRLGRFWIWRGEEVWWCASASCLFVLFFFHLHTPSLISQSKLPCVTVHANPWNEWIAADSRTQTRPTANQN